MSEHTKVSIGHARPAVHARVERVAASGSLFDAVEHRVDDKAQGGVGDSGKDLVWPAPRHLQAHQDAGNKEVNGLVNDVEQDREQEAGAGILDIDLDAKRRGAKSDHRF